MEAIIRTNNRNTFNSLIQFLKTLNFEVETRNEKSDAVKFQKQLKCRKKTDKEIHAFYNSIRIDMSNFKFDRDAANER